MEMVTSTLCEKLTERGHSVYMLSAQPPIDDDKLERHQFVLPANGDNITFLKECLQSKKIEIIVNQSERPDIAELIHQAHGKIPVISCMHTNPYAGIKGCQDTYDRWKIKYGILFALLRPLFDYRFYSIKKQAKERLSKIFKRQYEQSNAIVLLSKEYISTYAKLISTDSDKKIFAIPNPYPYESETTQTEKEKTIIFVGRLEYQKRVDRLLRIWKIIFKKNPNWKLQIIGDGVNRPFLEELTNKFGLRNIEFLGNREPEEFYRKASIICVTSSHEGLPMVLLEATQKNVIPIVFNSFESASDIIKDKCSGFLIKPFSTKDFSNTLNRLLQDDEYRETIRGNIIQEKGQNIFHPDAVVDNWERLFLKLHQQ